MPHVTDVVDQICSVGWLQHTHTILQPMICIVAKQWMREVHIRYIRSVGSAVVPRLPWDRTVVNKSDAGCVKSITSPNCHRHPLFIFYMHPHANLSKLSLSLSLSASLLFHGFIWLLSKLGQFSFHLIFWRPFNWCLGTPSRHHRHSNGRSFQTPGKVFKHCKNC